MVFLGGLQKTTLIDFPGRVACTIFTVGCNFRCPFCHNRDLVTNDLFKKSGIKPIEEKTILDFLDKRKKILDGVCITGGEPTLQLDLPEFCKKIKALGLEVKLDTNGSNPEILQQLIKDKLIDFIAMDVKSSFENYEKVIGIKYQVSSIKKSIEIILRSGLEYEFRTTIVPGLHNIKNMSQLAEELQNIAKSIHYPLSIIHYFLQTFRPQNCLDPNYLKIKSFTDKELKEILTAVKSVLPNAKLRGEG